QGLGTLLKEHGHDFADYIFANVGTGTPLHYFDGQSQRRVGGNGTGGGLLQGLGYLLSQITDFKQLTDMPQHGVRKTIDLKV
ncbi:pantothenate kinase, partial [Staphylococcus aureus]